MPATANIQVKVPSSQQQLSVCLQVIDLSEIETDFECCCFCCRIPAEILRAIEPLKDIVSPIDTSINFESIVEARLALQSWFQEDLGFPKHKLRHIIPRSTKTCCTTTARKSLTVQTPVLRFHTDSTHTSFTNIWLPISVSDYYLGFLHHPTLGIVTAANFHHHHKEFLQECSVAYFRHATEFGHAIVFRSGGRSGILHGSFRIQDSVPGDRESVEFRCQRYDNENDCWLYGEESSNHI